MTELILLSIVTATISFTVTETVVFKPMRDMITFIESCGDSDFFGKLIHCGYCFGFWVALVLEIIFKVRLFDTWPLLDYALTTLVITWLSGFQWILMCCLMKIASK
ncbi:hypothetical protein KAR91_56055 [Candidatus Pacearchaeota archaeon]|nr:hypothetical protein [Candidatus Pacearchaeota archaeon]